MKKKYGFIYIWRDRKHNRYYVGSHWGTKDDGYVCSSPWMKQAYKKRPEDFKRRILEYVSDRSVLCEAEHRWLQMIKLEELRGNRYYNHHNDCFGHWSHTDSSKTISQKISIKLSGRIVVTNGVDTKLVNEGETPDSWWRGRTDEHTARLNRPSTNRTGKTPWNKGKKCAPWSEETREKMKGRPPAWNKGMTMSAEFCEKSGAAQRGKKRGHMSAELRAKISAAKKGKPLSEANRLALKGVKLGRPWSEKKRASYEAKYGIHA